MAKSDPFANAFLLLVFNNVPIAGIGDGPGLLGSAVPGSLYWTAHTASPGLVGSPLTNETAYTGYARVAGNRAPGAGGPFLPFVEPPRVRRIVEAVAHAEGTSTAQADGVVVMIAQAVMIKPIRKPPLVVHAAALADGQSHAHAFGTSIIGPVELARRIDRARAIDEALMLAA